MNAQHAIAVDFRQIASTLKDRWRWWTIPAGAMTLLALLYAAAKSDSWQARQALVVRDEAVGDLSRQGRFDNSYALKAAQETVLEVARHRSVVEAALRSAGPEGSKRDEDWPASDDVQTLQEAISVTAPKGAEFGQTEVIYLIVKGRGRERAVTLAAAVCDQLEARLQLLRQRKAQSVIDELTRTWSLAQKDRDDATSRLQAIEAEVGADLGELRTLSESGGGDSNLRTALNQIKTDLRQATVGRRAVEEQLQLLHAARRDEKLLVGTSGKLLDAQPALRRLKDGLIDAQLRTAAMRGSRSPNHPQVQEAIAAEDEVRRGLQHELDATIAGLQADLQVASAQTATYEEQLAEVTARLDRLASLRAKYSNLQAEVRQRTTIVEKAQQDLATARGSQAAAASASLLTRLDAPLADDRPLGPGRAMIILSGLLGGLATGFGLVFLTAPAGRQLGRRWGDYLRHGRRATDGSSKGDDDGAQGRRGEDPPRGRRAEDRKFGRRAGDVQNRRATDPPTGAAAATALPREATPDEVSIAAARVRVTKEQASEPRDGGRPLSLTETLHRLVAKPSKHS